MYMSKILIAIIFISAIMDILPISKSIFEVNFLNRYIGKIKKGLVSLCLTGALLVSSVAVAALPEIIGLKELQPGMWGTGYTVIDASGEIRPFEERYDEKNLYFRDSRKDWEKGSVRK